MPLDTSNEEEMLSSNMIVQSPPDYTKLKIEGLHIALFIVIFLTALIGIRLSLTSSSPRTKAIVAIVISLVIIAFILLTLFMNNYFPH